VDLFNIGLSMDSSQLVKGDKALEDIATSGNKVVKTQANLQKASAKTGTAFNSLRGQAGNISYQLQDVAVQAQMGTNAFTILAQQGGQLFTPFSAAAGLLATLGGAIGGLVYNMAQGEDEIKSYTEELELLNQTVKVTDDGLVTMSDGFARLAESNPTLAMSKLQTQLDQVDTVMGTVSTSVDALFSGFDLDTVASEMDSFEGSFNDLMSSLVYDGESNVVEFQKTANELANVRTVLYGLSDGLDVSKEDALLLTDALSRFDTPQGVIDAASIVNGLAKQANFSNDEINELNVSLGDLSQRAQNLISSQQALQAVFENIETAASKSETAIADNAAANLQAAQAILALNQRIAVQNTLMNEGEAAAVRLSAVQSVGADVSEDLKNVIGDLAVEYFELTEAQKESAALEAQQAAINKQASALSQQLTLDAMGEVDAINAKAQAQKDLINSSTELSDVEKQSAIENIDAQAISDIGDLGTGSLVDNMDMFVSGIEDAATAMGTLGSQSEVSAHRMQVAFAALNVVQAIGAVLNQGQGDPYTAFARMAAMAAAVASLGVSMNGFSDSSSESVSYDGGEVSGGTVTDTSDWLGTSSSTEAYTDIESTQIANSLRTNFVNAAADLAKIGAYTETIFSDFSATVTADSGDITGAVDELTEEFVLANVAYIESFMDANETAIDALSEIAEAWGALESAFDTLNVDALETAVDEIVAGISYNLTNVYESQIESLNEDLAEAEQALKEAEDNWDSRFEGTAIGQGLLANIENAAEDVENIESDIEEVTSRLSSAYSEAYTTFVTDLEESVALINNVDLDSAWDLFAEQVANYSSTFYTEAEQLQNAMEAAAEDLEDFSHLGVDSTTTLTEFREAFEAFLDSDSFTAEGYAQWMAAADALAELTDASDGLDDVFEDITDFVRELLGLAADGSTTLESALSQYQAALAAASMGDQEALDNITTYADAYLEALKDAASTGLEYGAGVSSVASDLTNLVGGTIPAFASGGVHGGGLALVGEQGPEIVNMGTSRVYSNADSAKMFDNSELLNAVYTLNSNIVAGLKAVGSNTKTTAQIVDRWDVNGILIDSSTPVDVEIV
jgi:hypothetical protein